MEHIYLILPVAIYFLILIGINLFIKSKEAKLDSSEAVIKNYTLSNRKLSAFALAMTSASTYASAGSFIGGPGAAYNYGLGWVVIAMIQVPTMWFVFSILGEKLNEFATKHDCHTVNDILLARYKSKALALITSLILVFCFIASIVVQFVGAARLLEGALNISYTSSLISFIVVIGFYTLLGNFKSVSYADIFQGLVMFVGAIGLLVAVLYATGGLENAIATIKTNRPEILDPFNSIISPELYFSFWILVCFGVAGLPQTIVRTMANSSATERNKAIIIATIVLFVILLAMHLSGVLANAILDPEQLKKSPDLVIPLLIKEVMIPGLAAIFLIAPMASIVSTIDSQLIQITSTVVNDVIKNNFLSYSSRTEQNIASKFTPKRANYLIRGVSLAVILITIIIALDPPQIVVWLNLLAFGGLQATFLWPILLGMFFPSVSKYSALASVVVGISTYAILSIAKIKLWSGHQIVPALLFSLIAFTLVAIVEKLSVNKR